MANKSFAVVYGGTGSPPIGQSINYLAAIEVCRPIPGIPFNIRTDDPPRDTCPNTGRDLANFPLNHPTLTQGDIRTFGDSEMYITYVKLENYPRSGGTIRFTYFNSSNQVLYDTTVSLPVPDPNWTWWYGFAWATIGHFNSSSGYTGNEIIAAGQYSVRIQTTWGTETIYMQVTDSTPPPPPPSPYVVGVALANVVENSGYNIKVYKNNILYATVADRAFLDFNSGDIARFEAFPGDKFQQYILNDVVFTQNPFTVTINRDGGLIAYFASPPPPPPPGQFVLQINGKTGSVQVDANAQLLIDVFGGDLGKDIEVRVDELFPLPDTVLARGIVDPATGKYTTSVNYPGTAQWVITAYQLGLVGDAKTSNTITVNKIGQGQGGISTLLIVGGAALLGGLLLGRR